MNAHIDLDFQCGVNTAKPFLKWVGGKRSLLPELTAHMPQVFNRYFEPFVGGGAMFWNMLEKQNRLSGYHINDANVDLTNCYAVIRDHVEELITTLQNGQFLNEETCYYAWRAMDRHTEYADLPAVLSAARFLYLNRTCYNGLCRYNSSGQFNASFGKYPHAYAPDVDTLRACSNALNQANVKLSSGCFSALLDAIEAGDFVYLDPPYAPISATADFTSYTAQKFDWRMQFKLRDFCDALTEKGAFFMQSNSNAPFVYAMYDDYRVSELDAPRLISCKASTRQSVKEVIIRNY